MKNFKQERCKQNRNYLRYLTTDTLKEPLASTIMGLIEGKSFIKNKSEFHNGDTSKLFYELKIANKTGFIAISISKDHLINVKVSYKKTKEIKTRDLSEVVSLIKEILFT